MCPLLAGSSSGRHGLLPVLPAAPAGQAAADNAGIYAANKTGLFLCNLSYCHRVFLGNAPDFLPSGRVFSNLLPSALSLQVWQRLLRQLMGVSEASWGWAVVSGILLPCGCCHPPSWERTFWVWLVPPKLGSLYLDTLTPPASFPGDLQNFAWVLMCLFQLDPSSCFSGMTSL